MPPGGTNTAAFETAARGRNSGRFRDRRPAILGERRRWSGRAGPGPNSPRRRGRGAIWPRRRVRFRDWRAGPAPPPSERWPCSTAAVRAGPVSRPPIRRPNAPRPAAGRARTPRAGRRAPSGRLRGRGRLARRGGADPGRRVSRLAPGSGARRRRGLAILGAGSGERRRWRGAGGPFPGRGLAMLARSGAGFRDWRPGPDGLAMLARSGRGGAVFEIAGAGARGGLVRAGGLSNMGSAAGPGWPSSTVRGDCRRARAGPGPVSIRGRRPNSPRWPAGWPCSTGRGRRRRPGRGAAGRFRDWRSWPAGPGGRIVQCGIGGAPARRVAWSERWPSSGPGRRRSGWSGPNSPPPSGFETGARGRGRRGERRRWRAPFMLYRAGAVRTLAILYRPGRRRRPGRSAPIRAGHLGAILGRPKCSPRGRRAVGRQAENPYPAWLSGP